MRYLLIILALLLLPVLAFTQSAKKYFSAGEKFQEAGNVKDAIENYSKAVEVDPNYEKAYLARAGLYEKEGKKTEALEDFKKLIVFSPKDKELYYNAGRLSMSLQNYKDADQYFRKALERDKGYKEAIDLEIEVIHKTKDFAYGLTVAEMDLSVKETAQSFYNHAVMYDSLGKYVEATKEYKQSKFFMSKFIPAYVGLALVLIKQNKAPEALTVCETALTKEPNNTDVFCARAKVYVATNDFQNALNDITKVVIANPSVSNYKLRAHIYSKLGQFQNAVNDYSQSLKLDDKDIDAYLARAAANEQIQNYKQAVADYNKIATLTEGNSKMEALVKESKKKVFELSRESNKPEIDITSPTVDKGSIKIGTDKDTLVLKGVVQDESGITSITINNSAAQFDKDASNPTFTVKISGLTKVNELVVLATDAYNNVKNSVFKLEKTETNKPIVAVETPAASSDNEIFMETAGAEMYIQGSIKDESFIQSIVIEGVQASFSNTDLNPNFSAQISVANKNKIAITVTDINGNVNIQNYTLNRSGTDAGKNNPMGNTWVVFIENSKYQAFSSLEGPAKDVTMMKSALANYKFNKILHKKDMTKQEMEKFFSIELRDYVKNNNIQSLLVWYAGHGKYVSPTGYWVPVDGKSDDEFSYFGINNLKAAMQSYSAKLKHTLVITDACESGATFLLAMRGAEADPRCEKTELLTSKSAQVLTSAGYELASDNSQFTKTFANTLINNPDACISIDKVAKKVISAVAVGGNQAPKFGKIKDLEDENGTFFFMKK
jgi:tetratricopeptide (TPR) repeat protein